MAHGQTETEMESVHLVTKYKMGCCCGQCKKLMEAPVLRRVGFFSTAGALVVYEIAMNSYVAFHGS